ncbi:Transthyretin-like family-containing protein [Aphelenchoides besseyi]|nr:Transthyretin-like family-containing protein [Aphelenchoides besseyi]
MRYFLILLVFGLAAVEGMRKQGIAAKGRLLCGALPAASNTTKIPLNVLQCLFFFGPDPNDTLEEKFVDEKGEFKLLGFTRELTDIDPVAIIWHECMDEATPCSRKVKFVIPKKYIISTDPESDDQWIDFGVINLQSTFADEKRECIS